MAPEGGGAVSTVVESGGSEGFEVIGWNAIAVPKGLPALELQVRPGNDSRKS